MIVIVRGHINNTTDKYDAPRTWRISGFGLAKRFAICDSSWVCFKKSLPTFAAWIVPISVGSSAVNETCRSLISKELQRP